MKRRFSLNYLIIYIIVIAASSCGNGVVKKDALNDSGKLKYSEFLRIRPAENYTEIKIINPWDTSKMLHKYILVEKGSKLPKPLPEGTLIRTPVKNIIVYSSIHAAILEELGEIDKIAGVCDTQYITSTTIKKLVISGLIADCGNSTAPVIEKIAAASGEVIIASPFENGNYGAVEKLKIPIIEAADYTESHPLGRCEWIKLYGYLLDCSKKADSIFKNIEKRYNDLKENVSEEIVKSGRKKPTLIVEKKYGNAWPLPGGNSYTVKMYSDAGADYLFDDLDSKGDIQKSFETVLRRGIHSDFWLFKYAADSNITYKELKDEYPLYENFDAFKNHRVYGCNTLKNSYYNDIILHPDKILKDLVFIFHPELLSDYTPIYFLPLQICRQF